MVPTIPTSSSPTPPYLSNSPTNARRLSFCEELVRIRLNTTWPKTTAVIDPSQNSHSSPSTAELLACYSSKGVCPYSCVTRFEVL